MYFFPENVFHFIMYFFTENVFHFIKCISSGKCVSFHKMYFFPENVFHFIMYFFPENVFLPQMYFITEGFNQGNFNSFYSTSFDRSHSTLQFDIKFSENATVFTFL
jgi:hypothetical protein